MGTVRRVGGYILHKQIDPTYVNRVGGLILFGDKELPSGIEAKSAVEEMILATALETIPSGELTIGLPEVVDRYSRNTRVLVTWPGNSGVEGGTYFYYDRVSVGRLNVPAEFQLETETTSHQLLPRLISATGKSLKEEDFVNNTFDNGIKMEAAQNSYFFMPGSYIIVGGVEE